MEIRHLNEGTASAAEQKAGSLSDPNHVIPFVCVSQFYPCKGLCAFPLGPTEEELQVLRCQLVHGNLVVVDGAVDHVGFLFLQQDHARLDRVLDAKARDDAWAPLSDSVAAVSALPFGSRIPPADTVRKMTVVKVVCNLRIDNVDSGGLGEIEGNASCLERHEEDLDIDILHKVIDGALALDGRHAAVQHDRVDTGTTETQFDKLQHRRELGEDDGLEGVPAASELVEIVDKHFNLGRRRPILHLDPVDDGILLDQLLILLDIGLIEVNRQGL